MDSGSTSTDVVILNADGNVVSALIVPTGAGASKSSEEHLEQALDQAGINRADLALVVATGYGRAYIDEGDASVTEITCHAVGARHLYEKLGFVQLGTIPGGFRLPDGTYADICPYYHEL